MSVESIVIWHEIFRKYWSKLNWTELSPGVARYRANLQHKNVTKTSSKKGPLGLTIMFKNILSHKLAYFSILKLHKTVWFTNCSLLWFWNKSVDVGWLVLLHSVISLSFCSAHSWAWSRDWLNQSESRMRDADQSERSVAMCIVQIVKMCKAVLVPGSAKPNCLQNMICNLKHTTISSWSFLWNIIINQYQYILHTNI